ncbi:carbamoyltransferase C-terminal domain-containing protein [Mesorhizobium sp.]|uniref:carbamoyltransferase C-terminal domain-containing protein n=1 Tax=Mesorhizobium sp. TaxID=1871066 RepID=UPI00344BBEC2
MGQNELQTGLDQRGKVKASHSSLTRSIGPHSRSTDSITAKWLRHCSMARVIGWVQGNCEIGPRALGNRSILAAPFSKGNPRAVKSNQKPGRFPVAGCHAC